MRRSRIQTDGDGGAVQTELSMLTDGKPAVTLQNGSGVVPNTKPPRRHIRHRPDLQGCLLALHFRSSSATFLRATSFHTSSQPGG